MEGADQSYSTCIYANEMQALFSAFASNKRTHRQWKCIGIGIGMAQKYRRYLIDNCSQK